MGCMLFTSFGFVLGVCCAVGFVCLLIMFIWWFVCLVVWVLRCSALRLLFAFLGVLLGLGVGWRFCL